MTELASPATAQGNYSAFEGVDRVNSPNAWPAPAQVDPALSALTAPTRERALLTFDALYEGEFAFAWRNLRRLGVPEGQLRDAAQDVFLVVHRRLHEFEGRGTVRSWLYSIVVRVAAQYRRTHRRKHLGAVEDAHLLVDSKRLGPEQDAQQNESLRLLLELLHELDPGKREAFVLAELEGMTAPEIATALGVKLNTVYSRLRAARSELRQALRQRQTGKGEPG